LPLSFCAESGSFHLNHFDHKFPVSPPTYGDILGLGQTSELKSLGRRFKLLENATDYLEQAIHLQEELRRLAQNPDTLNALKHAISKFTVSNKDQPADRYSPEVERLHQLLEQQPYRLASWRTAADDINWRRFFDVNELGALRTERGDVFEAIHTKIFELVADRVIDGLRIDHVDGLANPRAYCRKLRRRISRLLPHDHQFAIYVEKILADGEHLPGDWQVDGTTGYEFMNQVSLIQHDALGALQLQGLWQALTGRPASFKDEVLEARRLILSSSLAGDLESLAQKMLLVARTDIATRDLTLGAIRRALFELIAHFPVYRTYSNAGPRSEQEQAVFSQALTAAKSSLQESDWPLLDQLDLWLGGQPLCEVSPGRIRRLRRKTLAHFQQLTSPTAAKAVEDTACYRSAVLLSRNDVGFDPARFSATTAHFHQLNQERMGSFPDSMLTTATHDHKRGEDTRARLAVISERSAWFANKVQEWRTLAQHWRKELEDGPAPYAGDELALYQILLASWPLDLYPDDQAGMQSYLERLLGWQEKAAREAKLRTRWTSPNQPYESACQEFLTHLLTDNQTREWRNDIYHAAMSLAPAGAVNSLGQTLLRLCSPGVPDLYQGCDFWDFSLVDPDNRRPVNYAPRLAAMESAVAPEDLLTQWRNGYIKQFLISKTLGFRHATPNIFSRGDYEVLEVNGLHAERILAFARHHQNQWIIVIVPRLCASLLGEMAIPLVSATNWENTSLRLPYPLANKKLIGLFTNQFHQPQGDQLQIRDLLAAFPVNLLYVSL
ncbi:MAG TPA: malto-oligosyltrehalose synthase, partial [Cellvibrio sp.]|nr:malto-oligosyltrehalose synthase [Cellvibrio sp.]